MPEIYDESLGKVSSVTARPWCAAMRVVAAPRWRGSIVREAVGQSTGNLENAKETRDEYSEQAGASSSSRQQSQQQKNSRAG
ncbi:hypothetical protein F4827_003660 [Paraburkholderia bannensis]|uniref:Uncharacterized protein n=1 Tax=Paraburkholderia bannensis TaxID=765414 RepID=A0A7W9U0R7_9BURK|nr:MULTISPECIES: hypothetical protein [Paraburkholderia]MBB3258791.1 hypothetical protein [Paraburkholderia sp. WP4_3_2]MBB6103805.1 hypothetical protein [Paraburkholderia bannensis]